jgi:hypothetical protein
VVEKIVQAPDANTPAPATQPATATATAYGASLPEEAATMECSIGEPCDLGTGVVIITNVERTDRMQTMSSAYPGNLYFVYTPH